MRLALYRKYRPKTFEDVVGQDHITYTLKNELKNGTFSHAYLFTGSRGTGKTSCAKILAKALNCLDLKDGDPCGTCANCVGIDDGSILDVVEIDAASNNSVDNVRDLREEAYYTPAVGKYRVYIIDEAHMLTTQAFNALLKIMEEPPAHVVFILATTEVLKLPETIRSRCQRFDFKRISSSAIVSRLKYICDQEGLSYSEDALYLLASLSAGGMRDAISLLDLCASGASSITEEQVVASIGVIGKDHLFELGDAISTHDSESAIRILDRMNQNSVDSELLCKQLIEHFRDLLILLNTDPKHSIDLVHCSVEDHHRYLEQIKKYSTHSVLDIMEELQKCLTKMRSSGMRYIDLEMSLVRICSIAEKEAIHSRDGKEKTVQDRIIPIAAKDTKLSKQDPVVQEPVTPETSLEGCSETDVSPKEQVPPNSSAKTDMNASFDSWGSVLEVLRGINAPLWGCLVESSAYLQGGRVLIDSDSDLFREMMQKDEYAKASIKQAILNVTGKKYSIGPYPKKQEEKADPFLDFIKSLDEKKIPYNIDK